MEIRLSTLSEMIDGASSATLREIPGSREQEVMSRIVRFLVEVRREMEERVVCEIERDYS